MNIDGGVSVDMIAGEVIGSPELDMNLDDEMLTFVRGLLDKIDNLGEGEALVVWKEIF